MLVPVAEKVTVPPGQMPAPRFEMIEAVGALVLKTVIVMLLLEATAGAAQPMLLVR